MEDDPEIIIRIATLSDVQYVYPILEEMERSARERGTGMPGVRHNRSARKYIKARLLSL